MMKYKTADDLLVDLLKLMDALPQGLSSAEARIWYSEDPATQELTRLWRVYQDALCDAPEPCIGVGRITYAEGVLVNAQKGLN
jgi:hypothetical protein